MCKTYFVTYLRVTREELIEEVHIWRLIDHFVVADVTVALASKVYLNNCNNVNKLFVLIEKAVVAYWHKCVVVKTAVVGSVLI